jgi:nitroreductase
MQRDKKEVDMQWENVGLNVFETILARRSVRSYRDLEVDRKTIRTLLEAAVRAPTATHTEPWAFVIVQDRQLLYRLSELAKPLFAEQVVHGGVKRSSQSFEYLACPDFNIFHDAGTLIIICARPIDAFAVADCWLAAENLMLTACAMELGTCVIGSAVTALNCPEIKTELSIPAEFSAIAPIIVGHPRNEAPATSRREPLVLAWH